MPAPVLFQKRKVGAYLQLKESRDSTVSDNAPLLYTGRKWQVEEAVEQAESDIWISQVRGYTQHGTQVFGCRNKFQKKDTHRSKLTKAVGKVENNNLYTRAAQQSLQGQ